MDRVPTASVSINILLSWLGWAFIQLISLYCLSDSPLLPAMQVTVAYSKALTLLRVLQKT